MSTHLREIACYTHWPIHHGWGDVLLVMVWTNGLAVCDSDGMAIKMTIGDCDYLLRLG